MRPWKHNERAAEPEIFDREVRAVCECYAEALSLHEEGVRLISTDEKTSIQALERLHPSLPMRPSLIERHEEHEYVRHGTRCLIANHRVLQPNDGQAVQVDVQGSSATSLNRWIISTTMH